VKADGCPVVVAHWQSSFLFPVEGS